MMRLAEFLASAPPGVERKVEGLLKKREPPYLNAPNTSVSEPDIEIYCGSSKCKGIRYFEGLSSPYIEFEQHPNYRDIYLEYWCRNCGLSKKTFALRVSQEDPDSNDGVAVKLGEIPNFGPPVPSRVVSLIGPDREIFLRGRRAENQGLGVGAFAYYRRVVENQRGRLIGKIAEVAKRTGVSPEVLEALAQAAKETQFSKAVEDVKSERCRTPCSSTVITHLRFSIVL